MASSWVWVAVGPIQFQTVQVAVLVVLPFNLDTQQLSTIQILLHTSAAAVVVVLVEDQHLVVVVAVQVALLVEMAVISPQQVAQGVELEHLVLMLLHNQMALEVLVEVVVVAAAAAHTLLRVEHHLEMLVVAGEEYFLALEAL
jgi:hypothetical protein